MPEKLFMKCGELLLALQIATRTKPFEYLNDLPIYHTRAKKTTFLATVVHPSFIDSKAVACAMRKFLTGDNLPSKRCKGKDMDIRVAELALAN